MRVGFRCLFTQNNVIFIKPGFESRFFLFTYYFKGLKPKLHGLALSMGENKTFNLKVKTSLKLFARYHAIDIHIKFCVGNISSVTI
jgi:hypothetical protein